MPDAFDEVFGTTPVATKAPKRDAFDEVFGGQDRPSQADIVAARTNAFGDVTPESMGQMRDQAEAAPADDETINRLLESQGHNQRVEADIAKYKAELDTDSFPGIFKKAPSDQAMAFAQMGEAGYRKAERDLALSRMGGVPTMGRARSLMGEAALEAKLLEDSSALRREEAPAWLRYGARFAVGAKEQLENAGAYVRENIVRPFFPESAEAMTRTASEYGMTEEGKAAIRSDTPGLGGSLAEMAGQTAAFIPQVALGGVPGAAAVSAAAAGGDAMAGVETAAFLTMAGGLTKLFGGASESVVRQVLAESGAMTAAGVATRLGFHGDAGTLQQAGVDALSGLAFGVMGGNARAKESAARFKSALEMGKTVEAAAKDAGIPMDRLKVPVPAEPMADSRFMAETARPMPTEPPGIAVPRPESPMPGMEASKAAIPAIDPVAEAKATAAQFDARVAPESVAPEKPVSVAPVAPVEAPAGGGIGVDVGPVERGPSASFKAWRAVFQETLGKTGDVKASFEAAERQHPGDYRPAMTDAAARALLAEKNAKTDKLVDDMVHLNRLAGDERGSASWEKQREAYREKNRLDVEEEIRWQETSANLAKDLRGMEAVHGYLTTEIGKEKVRIKDAAAQARLERPAMSGGASPDTTRQGLPAPATTPAGPRIDPADVAKVRAAVEELSRRITRFETPSVKVNVENFLMLGAKDGLIQELRNSEMLTPNLEAAINRMSSAKIAEIEAKHGTTKASKARVPEVNPEAPKSRALIGVDKQGKQVWEIAGRYYVKDKAGRYGTAHPEAVKEARANAAPPVEAMATEPAKVAVAPAVEPVRPATEAPPPPPAGGVSVKNEAVTASRAARGLDPIEKSPAQTFEGWNEQAAEVLKANPNKPQELIEEFTRKPRAHTPVETAVLTSHLRTLENARKAADADVIKAAESGNLDAVAEAKARSAAISDQYMTAAEVATTAAGAEAGRSLVSRKMVMAEDFSLLAMETRRRVANDGERLTEKQAAETKALHEKLAKATADLEAYQVRLESLQKRGAAAKEAVVRDATYGKKNTLVTVEAYEQTRAALREKLSRLSVNPFDPAILADLAKIGAFHVEAGLRNFAAWSKAMLDDLGEKVGPHLKDVWKAAQTEVGLPFTKAKESLAATTKEGRKVTENATAVQKIAEHFVRAGVTDRSELVEKVHEVLQEFSPGITYRQTMDAISGYGVFKALNSDHAKVRLREMKAELQQLSKLEDMASGKAPSKTGVERQSPSDAARELMKKVNEAKKRGGYEVKDPATQLKTALDATKTRLTHEIADLERQIASKTKDVNDRTPLALDAEAAALKERRDALKQQFDETFGKPGLTDAQRIEAAIKATEKSIAEYERRVATGDVFPEARPDGPTDPRLDALRARRDALRATVEDIRANATPHASEGERALKALKSRLTNRIADLTDRMARGDFSPKEKKAPTVLDKQAIELEAKLIAAKKEWGAALTRDAWNKKNVVQKAASIAFHTFRDVSRALMTSMDMSVFGRQGSILVNSHPMIGVESFKIGSKALMDPLADAKMEARIHSDPDFRLSRQAGLFIAEHGAGATTPKMEEMMLSRAVEKIPLIGRGVAASQRAYTTALNNIRFQAFKAGLRNLSDGAPSLSAAKAWANFINVATGRGGAPDSRVLNGLSNFFFSPRLVYSRFQFILGQPLWGGEWKGSGAARVLIAKEYGRYVAGLSVFYALAHLANGQIEKDGKVRWGNSVVDPLAGLSQAGKLLSRTVPDLARGVTGQNQRIVKYGQKSAWDYTTDFIRTKLAPLPGAAVNLMTGKTSVGEPTSVKDEALSMVMPMSFRDVYKATKEHGVPKGIALGILSMLGYGLQHYPKRGR